MITSAFAVDIDREKLVSHLKEAIKESQKPFFDSVPTKNIKLWKIPISDDHVNPLSNLSLENSNKLLAIRKISKYFPDLPPEEHIHVLVSPLPFRAESRNCLCKSPRCRHYLTSPHILYGLSESDDSLLSVFPPFTCEHKKLKDGSSQSILEHLIAELEAHLKFIPISENEALKSQYVCSYLVAGVNLYEGKFELRPEKNITGPNGHGPVDFAIDLLQSAKTVGMTE
ncbi:hypothetical protein C1645_742401, partial [Glomus cerebriforme]